MLAISNILPALHYRLASPDDLEGLLRIEQHCFSGDRINRRQMRYLLGRAKAICFVAENGNELIAYGLCLLPPLPRPARLYSLAVLPAWGGRGIGKSLCQHLMETLQSLGYQRLRLEVAKSNASAQALYQSLGFQPLASLPAYYEDGGDGVRMEARFS